MRASVWKQKILADIARVQEELKTYIRCVEPGCNRTIAYQLDDKGRPVGWTHVRGNL